MINLNAAADSFSDIHFQGASRAVLSPSCPKISRMDERPGEESKYFLFQPTLTTA